jgi:glutathione S-transferase
MDWQATTLNPALVDAFLHALRLPEPQRRPEAVKASVERTEPLLDILDAQLAGRACVAGGYTMGDIPLACSVHRWYGLPIERRRHPNVEAWIDRLRARPAYANVLSYPIT